MTITIRNRETEHLLEVVKTLTRQGTSQLVRRLLKEELQRLIDAKEEREAKEQARIRNALGAARKLQALWRQRQETEEAGQCS